MISAGLDVGTRFVKACVAQDGQVAGLAVEEISSDVRALCADILQKAMAGTGIKPRHVQRKAATGFGSSLAGRDWRPVKESVCAARAAHALCPEARTVVDAGGLFISITGLGPDGAVDDAITNDRCAAGSGKFLEMVAAALEVPLAEVSSRAARSRAPYAVAATCAVFAESEVISQINAGAGSEDVLAGVIRSIASRAATLLEKITAQDKIAVIGGLSRIEAFVSTFEDLTGRKAQALPLDGQAVTAYGAALAALGNNAPRRRLVFWPKK